MSKSARNDLARAAIAGSNRRRTSGYNVQELAALQVVACGITLLPSFRAHRLAFLKHHPRLFRFFLAHAAHMVRFLPEIFIQDRADAAPLGFLNGLQRKPRILRVFEG